MAKVLGFVINIQGTEAAIENATDLRLAIQEINKQLKDPALTKPQYDKLEKQLIDLKARQKEVNAQIRDSVTERRAELKAAENNVGAYRQLSAQLTATRTRYKDLAAAGKENTVEAQQLQSEILKLDKRLKDIDGSVGQFQRNVGDYTNSILNAIPGLGAFSDGIDNIGKATGRVGKAIATSFFIFEIINQLTQGIKAIGEFSEEFRKLQGEIQNTTQQTGDALVQTTAKVKAIADTYQEDAKQIAVAANTLSKEFGVSITSALELVEAGFRKGANAQGDFLDQLREYPTQFREAGFSLEQFVALSIQAANEGIYSDKGLDAVKEFGIRIREQTKATRGALENAFGEKFTNELFTNLNNGSITTVQALAKVSTGLRDVDLTAEQTQRVIADVFGGPGEDAGLRYLQLLADIDKETENVTESTNIYQAQQKELFEANLALSEAQAEVANQLSNTSSEIEILKTKGKTFLLEAAAGILKFFDRLPAFITGTNAAISQFFKNIQAGFGLLGETGSITEAFEKGFAFELDRIDKENEISKNAQAAGELVALNTEAGIRNKLSELRAKRGGLVFGSDEFKAVDKEIKALEKRLDKFNPKPKSLGISEQAKKEREQAEKEAEKAEQARVRALEKEQADTRKQLQTIAAIRSETIRLALGGATELVEATVTQTSDGFRILGDTLIERSQGVLQRLKDATKEFQEREPIEPFDLEQFTIGLQTTFDTAIPLIEAFQQRAAAQATQAIDAQISEQQQSISNLEERIAQSSGMQKEVLEKLLTDEKAALEKSNIEKEKLEADLAKKAKQRSILTSIINTALAVGRALANPPGPPFSIPQAIAAGIQGAAQTAIIAAQPLAEGGEVIPVELPDSSGKITMVQNIPATRKGDKVLVAARPGEVFLNRQHQAALGGSSTFRAIGVPGFAGGGVISPPISAPMLPQATGRSDSGLMEIVKQLDAKTDAINRRIDRIRTFVVTEDITNDIAEGDAIRTQATFE